MTKKIVRILLLLLLLSVVFVTITAWPYYTLLFAAIWSYRRISRRLPLHNVHIFIISLVCSLSLSEVALRVIGTWQSHLESISSPVHHILFTSYMSSYDTDDRGWLYIAPPHLQARDREKEFQMASWMPNSEGLHDKEWHLAKGKKYRIMVLGDSFTEGVGSTGDSTCPHLLEMASDTLEVMNAGLSGSDPAFELRLLEMRLFKYHPDMVIMSVNSTDIGDFMARGGMERFKEDSTVSFRQAPWWEPCYASSFIIRYIVHNVCALDYTFMSPAQKKQAHDIAMLQIAQVLVTSASECRQRQVRFLAHFHPFQEEVRLDSMECTTILRSIKKQGVETFDMLEYFTHHGIDATHAGQYYWPIDRHNNNRGYAVMAEGLGTALGRMPVTAIDTFPARAVDKK